MRYKRFRFYNTENALDCWDKMPDESMLHSTVPFSNTDILYMRADIRKFEFLFFLPETHKYFNLSFNFKVSENNATQYDRCYRIYRKCIKLLRQEINNLVKQELK